MCTVSWVHEGGGYHLLCSRDEKKSRAAGLGPRLQARGWVRFLAPIDPESAGTWIGVNEFGVSACVLNGANLTHRTRQICTKSLRSRGLIVRELIWAKSVEKCALWLSQLDLAPFPPFTLVLLEPGEAATVAEWDGENTTLIRDADSWMPLTSSSHDPEGVRKTRLSELAGRAQATGKIDPTLLYRFHSSHCEQPNAYSPCMHRADAETVSFSRVIVTPEEIKFLYSPAAPCKASGTTEQLLRRAA